MIFRYPCCSYSSQWQKERPVSWPLRSDKVANNLEGLSLKSCSHPTNLPFSNIFKYVSLWMPQWTTQREMLLNYEERRSDSGCRVLEEDKSCCRIDNNFSANLEKKRKVCQWLSLVESWFFQQCSSGRETFQSRWSWLECKVQTMPFPRTWLCCRFNFTKIFSTVVSPSLTVRVTCTVVLYCTTIVCLVLTA